MSETNLKGAGPELELRKVKIGWRRVKIGSEGETGLKTQPAIYGSDGRVVRASASGAVDSGLIPSPVKPMILKLVITAFLLDVQQ